MVLQMKLVESKVLQITFCFGKELSSHEKACLTRVTLFMLSMSLIVGTLVFNLFWQLTYINKFGYGWTE